MLAARIIKVLIVGLLFSVSQSAFGEVSSAKFISTDYELNFVDAGDVESPEKRLGALLTIQDSVSGPKNFFLICGDFSVANLPLGKALKCSSDAQEGSFFVYFRNAGDSLTVFNLNLIYRNSPIPDEVTETVTYKIKKPFTLVKADRSDD